MFLAGAACCYFFLLPKTLAITDQFSNFLGFQAMWTIQSYISFTLQFMIGIGLGFEVPVIILLLVRLGIVTDQFLRKYRPHMVVGIFIAAAMITPTTDAFTLCAVAIPMVLLYETCIWIAWWMNRSKKTA
jgi:sec-independent protein translocase protein TatC